MGSFCLGIIAITCLIAGNWWVKWITIIVVGSSIATVYVFYQSTGSLIDSDDISIFTNASEHISTYLFSTISKWIVPLLSSILLLWFLSKWLDDNERKSFFSIIGVALFLLSVVSAYYILSKTNGVRKSFPSPIKLIVLSSYAQHNGLYNGERRQVKLKNLDSPLVDHIVVIVDESVRGDILPLALDSTSYIINNKDHFIDFGVSYSGAICSDYSNILLMSGIQPHGLPDIKHQCRINPTLFQYAQNVGMKTGYYDNQSLSNKPDGFMTYADFDFINDYHQVKRDVPGVLDYERDLYGLKALKNHIIQSNSSFSYVVKYGCHFPYENTYPNHFKKETPIASVVDWDRSQRDEVLNNYRNSLRWVVDHYFEELEQIFEDEEQILFIYTSDHGQHLMEDDEIDITHCYKGLAPEEMARVPLMFYSPDTLLIRDIEEKINLDRMKNKASHFNIFDTVLELLGYNETDLTKSLLQKEPEVIENYYSGDIFGRNPLYKNQIKSN